MDKFFGLSTLPLLVFIAARNGHIRHSIFLLVMTMLLLSRDQWVTFLRSIGSIYNVEGGAKLMGKIRTAFNFPLICAIYHFEAAPVQLLSPTLLFTMEGIAILINLLSVYTYTRHYWPSLRKSVSLNRS